MSGVRIEIGHLRVGLHGISAAIVEEAAIGLDALIARRLGTRSWAELTAFEIGELSLDPLHTEVRADPAALRGIIADRLVQTLEAQLPDRTFEREEQV